MRASRAMSIAQGLSMLALALATACSTSSVTCPTGQTACEGVCYDLQTDVAHCGLCNRSCPANATCVAGSCTCPVETPDTCGTQCVNKATDALNCGACNFACGLGTCQASVCTCTDGSPTCNGACPNYQIDPRNCGGCTALGQGVSCPTGFSCSAGACVCTGDACPPAPAVPTLCTSFATDPQNCGGCGITCGTNQLCTNGACTCAKGLTSCSGVCVDLLTSATNCGACGNVCSAGQSCTAGKCTGGCTGVLCNGVCCPGTACCTTGTVQTCQPQHDNGLATKFYDCTPVGTYTESLATAAADAWATGSTQTWPCGGTVCVARSATVGGIAQCGVWCYDGLQKGQLGMNNQGASCLCPLVAPITATWY